MPLRKECQMAGASEERQEEEEEERQRRQERAGKMTSWAEKDPLVSPRA